MKHLILFVLIGILYNISHPLSAQNRTVLCELFTSTTCPPCVGANQGFDTWLSSYTKKSRVAVVKYHVWWPSPGNDPYYLANTAQVTTRNTFYGNNYAPHMFINGSDAGSSYTGWNGAIEAELANTPPLEIIVSGTVKNTDANIIVQVKAGSAAIPSGVLKVYVALTESGLLYTGTNGDPKHENVMRLMAADANGETFSIANQETKTFKRPFTLDAAWKTSNCTVVAFVQAQDTKTIVQAAVKNVIDMVSDVRPENTVPEIFSLEQNYPNPFNPSTTIRYSLPNAAKVKLSLFDMLGKEIAQLVDEEQSAGWKEVEWNSMNMTSGVYFYRLTAGAFADTKKMTVVK
jgi:hypothetical protein